MAATAADKLKLFRIRRAPKGGRKTGRENFSFRREATRPTTPGCQPSDVLLVLRLEALFLGLLATFFADGLCTIRPVVPR
ncbi:hypothetical protein [Bradyrhizobium sp. CCGE-LA001]|uniref:hypothetical protein n=1 Tax=Bradyrhizobium sp. CCGE-LA001 TaxID=1223566 RepID=UPI0002AA9E0F|nr:hypothetical protein [Bradyrhizobium sp. CCGE-LA001]AMA56856.1 hypothetical protein BCCGELA001_11785 [Bradyrhizobium sp. CCGE-LA001]